jgi:SecD/SecF fusion protein
MDKRRKWQRWVIYAVLLLTVYNILPTVFYYSKPLKNPIEKTSAKTIALDIAKRVNQLEDESVQWLHSFSSLLDISPSQIKFDTKNPQWIEMNFATEADAAKIRKYLPRSGAQISFVPGQLMLPKQNIESDPKKVLVLRQISTHFDVNNLEKYFSYVPSRRNEAITPELKELTLQRVNLLASHLTHRSSQGDLLSPLHSSPAKFEKMEKMKTIVKDLNLLKSHFGSDSQVITRYLRHIHADNYHQELTSYIDVLRDSLKKDPSLTKENSIAYLLNQASLDTKVLLKQWKKISKKNFSLSEGSDQKKDEITEISLNDEHPFIQSLQVDWNNNLIHFKLYDDVKDQISSNEYSSIHQLLIKDFAELSHALEEKIITKPNHGYTLALTELEDCQSLLTLNLSTIAHDLEKQTLHNLQNLWTPQNTDFSEKNFPIVDCKTFKSLPPEEQKFCLVVQSPINSDLHLFDGAKDNSLYVVAIGLDKIMEKYEHDPSSLQAREFLEDAQALRMLLRQCGFIDKSIDLDNGERIVLFEKTNFYEMLLAATRENFQIRSNNTIATLEFTNTEQRILTSNKIDTSIHEDLLKAKDDYIQAQVSLDPSKRFSAPKPPRSPFWNNVSLSAKKYFRGDERKILKWGLDLSGGKSILIELRDEKNLPVTKEESIVQGMNELHARVNKMGLSEVTIRKEGNKIALDFPGSQNLSAEELVKASTMYFHVVNEKFHFHNHELAPYVNQFLQEVWNEAVVKNQKTPEGVKAIALNHLYGESLSTKNPQPRSEAAKILFDQGLRLATDNEFSQGLCNDSMSTVAIMREELAEGHSHPLMIVFNNYALEGSSLQNIYSSYEPSKGNFLSFEVKSQTKTKKGQQFSPRDLFHQWTSLYCKENVVSTPNDYHGSGWRMAVILNGTVISAPKLDQPLRDNATISGGFSQREVNALVADLKAGSLTYYPKILSEKNISPELGAKDRIQGIWATGCALILVILAMVGYYRFAGLVASVAVIFNLIIMWAILQNLNATLTLAGISGIILTLGMAVDANVLVFERVKEELRKTGKIATALQAGYKKAFSAILDSNLTTILAALILLNFESGPIKAFAITLIIGIASSMFTALFLTRFFFAGWVNNPKHQTLYMSDAIKAQKFDFLKYSKVAFSLSTLFILVGSFLIFNQKHSIFGMDFTGGYTLHVELTPKEEGNYRSSAEEALAKVGISGHDIEVREMSPSNHLRIRLSTSLENEGKSFYNLPEKQLIENATYTFENNPRLALVLNALTDHGLHIEQKALETIDQNWSVMSGQLSNTMRTQALLGLGLALFAIFIYITFRFEFTYAFASIICVFHDVLITLAFIGVFYALGIPLHIDLLTVTALMTIIGYSLNDTIIIFDRIREDSRMNRKLHLKEIVNQALNQTLSRTTITSGTTLLVLLALVFFGGPNIFNFAMIMTVGVVIGTLSSIFIASPIMLMIQKYEIAKEKHVSLQKGDS